MAPQLKEYLTARPRGEFRRVPHYFPTGDYLTYFLSDERCFASRLDDFVTVYVADGTDRIVGCKVKGVSHLLRTAGAFGVDVKDTGQVKLGLFFFPGGAKPESPSDAPRVRYYELLQQFADIAVDRAELVGR